MCGGGVLISSKLSRRETESVTHVTFWVYVRKTRDLSHPTNCARWNMGSSVEFKQWNWDLLCLIVVEITRNRYNPQSRSAQQRYPGLVRQCTETQHLCRANWKHNYVAKKFSSCPTIILIWYNLISTVFPHFKFYYIWRVDTSRQ